MQNLKCSMILIILISTLIGCQTQVEPLPTQVDLNATNAALAIVQTETAVIEEQTATAPTATSLRPTLPPTFTNTPDIPPTPTPVPTLDPNISPTPEGFNADGTIYYNYNGDSIARVLPDGTLNEIIITFGVDQPITDLTASPDGQLLAFVAPGPGSAREVWVSNRDGTYLQKVSCLGFGEVRQPTFAPDSNGIAFFAAPLATTDMTLFVADFAGSNDCPNGNNQQQLFPVNTTRTGSLAWNASSDMIYYNAGGTRVYDFGTNASYILSGDTGFGADLDVAYNYATDQLAYLRTTRNLTTGEQGGSIVIIDSADDFRAEYEIRPLDVYAQSLQWRGDNAVLLYATNDEVALYDVEVNSRLPLIQGLTNPLATFAPNFNNYAYTAPDPETGVMQIFTSNRLDRRDSRQVTSNPEGTIHTILWLVG